MKKRILALILALGLLASGCSVAQTPAPSTQEMTSAPETQATPPETEPATAPTTEETETTEETTEEATEPLPEGYRLTLTVKNSLSDPDELLTDDNSYTVRHITGPDRITFTTDEPMQGLMIKWENIPESYTISWDGGSLEHVTQGYLHEYVALGECVTEAWIDVPEGVTLSMNDVFAYSYGTLPTEVQVWEPSEGYADILAIPTHADDEQLFFGPLLAYYAIERELDIQVAYMTTHTYEPVRAHERLDGLWALGIRRYPIIGELPDMYSSTLYAAKCMYDEDAIVQWQVELIRRFQPMVIIGHDQDGEYGHGAHRLNTYCLLQAVEIAGDATQQSESAEAYGTWDTPKLYLHLEKTGQLTFPVDEPMENADGATPYEIASIAYNCHHSQHRYYPKICRGESPQFDCRLFGLIRSTVGEDSDWDIWENVPERQ